MLAIGVVGPILWVVLTWASRRCVRRIWLLAAPIWLATLWATGRLGAAMEQRSVIAVAGELPFALVQLFGAWCMAVGLFLFAHWIANGTVREADVDD